MEKAVCEDGRARGMFQFYGANRTGHKTTLVVIYSCKTYHRTIFLIQQKHAVQFGSGDFEGVELLYEDVPDTLSQLIRTAFIPRDTTQFLVADFSAIEARVIAWFAGEE